MTTSDRRFEIPSCRTASRKSVSSPPGGGSLRRMEKRISTDYFVDVAVVANYGHSSMKNLMILEEVKPQSLVWKDKKGLFFNLILERIESFGFEISLQDAVPPALRYGSQLRRLPPFV